MFCIVQRRGKRKASQKWQPVSKECQGEISRELKIRQTERRTPLAFWRIAVRHSLAKSLNLPSPAKLAKISRF
jgi:hypothetical protein